MSGSCSQTLCPTAYQCAVKHLGSGHCSQAPPRTPRPCTRLISASPQRARIASSLTMPRPPVSGHQTYALPSPSPHQRSLSPFGLNGPQTAPPLVLRPSIKDFENVSSLGNRAFASPLSRLTDQSGSFSHASLDEMASRTTLPHRSRLARIPSERARPRTLSPARQCPKLVLPVCKDDDDALRLPRSVCASALPPDRDPVSKAAERPHESSFVATSSFAMLAMKDHKEVKQGSNEIVARILSREEAGERLRQAEDLHGNVQRGLTGLRDTTPIALTTPSPVVPPCAAPAAPTTSATSHLKDQEVLEPVESGWIPSADELKPWLEAAASFKMSSDFEVEAPAGCDFASLMAAMKKESAGKWTIQAMADKLMLHGLLENLGLPHMPMIFAHRNSGQLREHVEDLVDKLIAYTAKNQPYDIVVKPTHLSSAQGVLSLGEIHAPQRESTIRQVEAHMRKYLDTQASKQESLALQSLKPGFIGQPKYKSVVAFKAPLELKVCALWGKVRSGVWWWGSRASGPAEVPHRNMWIVRIPSVHGELNDDDGWEVIHSHPGGNVGWENAVKLFKRHMPEIASLTETLATALGAPFIRADFFVGSPGWGVRLNEVAYGCGIHYRNLLREKGSQRVIDDKPAMAEILRKGMEMCTSRIPAHHFLQTLGMHGTEYADSDVAPLGHTLRNPSSQFSTASDQVIVEFAAHQNLCKTMKELPLREEEPSKVLAAKAPEQAHRKIPNIVKPLQLHSPALMMPRVATVITANTSVLLGRVPPSPLKLRAPESHKARTDQSGIALAQPRVAPLILRPSGPLSR